MADAPVLTVYAGRPRVPLLFGHQAVVAGIARLADALAVSFAWFFALWVRFVVFPPPTTARLDPWDPPAIYLLSLAIGVLVTVSVLSARGLYGPDLMWGGRLQRRRLLGAIAFAFLLIILIAFLTKTSEQMSRVWLVGWAASSLVFVAISQTAYRGMLRSAAKAGYLARNAVVIGAGEQGRRLIEHLHDLGSGRVRLLGVFDDRTTRVPKSFGGANVLGPVNAAEAFIRTHKVDQVFVALPLDAEKRISEIVARLRLLPVDVLVTLGWAERAAPALHLQEVGGKPMLSVSSRPLSGWDHAIKLVEDYLLGGLLFLTLSPLLLLIAVLVKLDSPGPVFFRQGRYGFNNDVFQVWKFRTMRHDPAPDDTVPQACRNDPRVTRLGQLLRRTSLDELPQIFNVLNGTMSLVGPRPHAVAHNQAFAGQVNQYYARHRVKPGITGWAQVNGWRGETDTIEKIEQRVKFDLEYIENWSIWLDVKILVLTLFVVFSGRNAY